MTTTKTEAKKRLNDLVKKWSDYKGDEYSKDQIDQYIESGKSPEYVAYYKNLWKKCDGMGSSFSNLKRQKFHNSINDFPIEEGKAILWDIIKEICPEYDFTEHNKPVINDLVYYFTGNKLFSGDLTKGIWLYGKPGCGKSFLMSLFMAFTVQLRYRQFKCYHCEEVAINLKSNIHLIDDYTNYPALFDDLMNEKKINNYGDYIDTMAYILKARDRKFIPTHATSNRMQDDIQHSYGELIDSRASAMFNFIYLHSDKDYRKL